MRGDRRFLVRLRYTKRGKVRWISHRDVARAMERAFRITQLPLAFSQGFSPRSARELRACARDRNESDAEYLDLGWREPIDLDGLCPALSEALPEGIEVTGAAALADRAPALQEAVTAVSWRVEIDRSAPAAAAGLAAATLVTTRHRKGREATEDVRPVDAINLCDEEHEHGRICHRRGHSRLVGRNSASSKWS